VQHQGIKNFVQIPVQLPLVLMQQLVLAQQLLIQFPFLACLEHNIDEEQKMPTWVKMK